MGCSPTGGIPERNRPFSGTSCRIVHFQDPYYTSTLLKSTAFLKIFFASVIYENFFHFIQETESVFLHCDESGPLPLTLREKMLCYRKSRFFQNVLIGFSQLPGQLEFVRMSAAQYLPPRGRGTAKRWMRNGDTFPFLTQSSQRVQPFPMYLFNEMHTDSEHIAVPHPPPCGGTFPPGEGLAFRHPCKHQFISLLS